MLVIYPDKFCKGSPDLDNVVPCGVTGEVPDLLTTWPTDAHFMPISTPGGLAFRPNKDCSGVLVTMLVIDVDCPKGTALEDWLPGQHTALDSLAPSPGYYGTRGGYRLLWSHPNPLAPTEHEAVVRAALVALGERGIVGDPACTNWNRLFRCPRVVREGVAQEYPVLLDSIPDHTFLRGGLFSGIEDTRVPLGTLENFGAIPQGQRNSTLFRLACRASGRGLPLADVLAETALYNDAWAGPPVGDEELARIVDSAVRQDSVADTSRDVVDSIRATLLACISRSF